jgi:broad specificity phosphatase PhoE
MAVTSSLRWLSGRRVTLPFGAVPTAARSNTAGPVRLHLVRHGRAAAGWDRAADPGLDAHGGAQAVAVAEQLATTLEPQPIVSSPLARARETAAPLAARWGVGMDVVGAFGEIPSPNGALAERGRWLRSALVGHWDDLGPEVHRWRLGLIDAAKELPRDAIVFTHFVAINALVGWAEGRSEVTTFAPANGSVTELLVDTAPDGTRGFVVVRRGSEAPPQVG